MTSVYKWFQCLEVFLNPGKYKYKTYWIRNDLVLLLLKILNIILNLLMFYQVIILNTADPY